MEEDIRIDSVQILLQVIKNVKYRHSYKEAYVGPGHTSTSTDYCFRGIKNINYLLQPRAVNERLCKVEYNDFDQPLEVFRREASGYLRNTCGDDKIKWMQYAQHFGVPTRLLDFSTNPLVALYFSCGESEHDGVLWMINIQKYERVASINYMYAQNLTSLLPGEYLNYILESFSFEKLYPAFFIPEYIDARMTAQASRFLLWPNTQFALEDIISSDNFMSDKNVVYDNSFHSKFILKMVVPKDRKKSLLKELDLLGINEKALFPGLDSIGAYINQLFNPNYQVFD